METLVEIRDPPQYNEVVVMLRCWSGQEVECARQRSTIIQMVLGAKEKFCPKIPTKEFLLHPSQVREYPLKSPAEQDLISIREVSRAVVEGDPGAVNAFGKITRLEEMLSFEPYYCLGEKNIREVFSDQNLEPVSDTFIRSLARCDSEKAKQFEKLLVASGLAVGSSPSMGQVLRQWRDNSQGTRKCLRETLDQFSVFAGRNPLVSDVCVSFRSLFTCFHALMYRNWLVWSHMELTGQRQKTFRRTLLHVHLH